ncbi:replication initiator protein [Microviridae sp.]|nr:replication initiator protein [Microviridae sp.]
MPCYKPLRAWQSPAGGPVAFSPSRTHDKALQLPCGQCIGCRLEKSRQWATRCLHEASMHDNNAFITLTYDDEHLPWDGSLNKKHFQDFMKRLRFKHRKKAIRYFHCGEYGEALRRPHYHALLFGHDFDDKTRWTERDGIPTYVSEELQQLWPFGFTTTGRITWESAAYCARYVTKKQTGQNAKNHYWLPLATDLEVQLEPEYATMSLKPAIGKTWFDQYKGDCFPSDFITQKGKKLRVPRYYDKLLAEHNEQDLKTIKENRKRKAQQWHHECTPKRLKAREQCAHARLATLKRNLEG